MAIKKARIDKVNEIINESIYSVTKPRTLRTQA